MVDAISVEKGTVWRPIRVAFGEMSAIQKSKTLYIAAKCFVGNSSDECPFAVTSISYPALLLSEPTLTITVDLVSTLLITRISFLTLKRELHASALSRASESSIDRRLNKCSPPYIIHALFLMLDIMINTGREGYLSNLTSRVGHYFVMPEQDIATGSLHYYIS